MNTPAYPQSIDRLEGRDGFQRKIRQLAVRRILSLFVVGLVLILVSCAASDQNAPLTQLRIGVLPDQSKGELYEQYTPLFEFLTQETGLSCQLIIPNTYEELSKLFREQEIDLAYFGAFTFIRENKFSGAVPLVMRDVDAHFRSVFFTNGASQVKDLSDLKGKTVSFGSKLSTSGHLMPRYFMGQLKNIIPEEYFKTVLYSGKHDRTAYWVRDGRVDLGVANSRIIYNMINDGRLKQGDIQVLWETPPYPDYVWTLHERVNSADQIRIRQAFLKLSADNKRHAEILGKIDAKGFLPADIADFSQITAISRDMKLLD